MKRLLAVVGAVLAIGCAASGPASLDEATRPIGASSSPLTSPEREAPPAMRGTATCVFDAECPKGQRCEAPRTPTTQGTCIASADTPHS